VKREKDSSEVRTVTNLGLCLREICSEGELLDDSETDSEIKETCHCPVSCRLYLDLSRGDNEGGFQENVDSMKYFIDSTLYWCLILSISSIPSLGAVECLSLCPCNKKYSLKS
jgi:hypothetical protein